MLDTFPKLLSIKDKQMRDIVFADEAVFTIN